MTERIEVKKQVKVRRLGEKENYKYLWILEAGTINQVEMKDKKRK